MTINLICMAIMAMIAIRFRSPENKRVLANKLREFNKLVDWSVEVARPYWKIIAVIYLGILVSPFEISFMAADFAMMCVMLYLFVKHFEMNAAVN